MLLSASLDGGGESGVWLPGAKVSPLWGSVYAEKLVSMTLPALLAPGNLKRRQGPCSCNNPYLTPIGMGQFVAYEAVFSDDDKSGIRFQGTWLTAQICKPGSLSHGILAGLALVASVECEKSPASAHQALQGEGLPFFIFSKSTTVGDDAALSRDTSR
jgi:hypothetical protein